MNYAKNLTPQVNIYFNDIEKYIQGFNLLESGRKLERLRYSGTSTLCICFKEFASDLIVHRKLGMN